MIVLTRDLQCSDHSIKRWLQILENLYVIFKVSPYHKNIARSLLKSPKYYFYDTGQVLGNDGIRFENLTACALLKECHFLEDCEGEQRTLSYLQTKDGRELDFFITSDGAPLMMIEVKWKDRSISPNFQHFSRYFDTVQQVQITGVPGREKSFPAGIELRNGSSWLTNFSL